MSAIVLDASAGVEIAFQTPVGRQLQAKIPIGSTTWVPEHYFVEVAGVLRRAEINGRHTEAQVRVALDPAPRCAAPACVGPAPRLGSVAAAAQHDGRRLALRGDGNTWERTW